MKKIIKIDGMTCNHCKMNVEKALKQVAGVKAVEVSLFLKQAELEADESVNQAALKQAIVNAGYQIKE
jgi:copper ion binding protein